MFPPQLVAAAAVLIREIQPDIWTPASNWTF